MADSLYSNLRDIKMMSINNFYQINEQNVARYIGLLYRHEWKYFNSGFLIKIKWKLSLAQGFENHSEAGFFENAHHLYLP